MRYVIIKSGPGWDDEDPLLPHLTVHDRPVERTGLLDASGNEIGRLPNPIGFTAEID